MLSPKRQVNLTNHPRVGGEKIPPKRRTFYHSGSPPRRRGKDIIVHPRCVNFRITPAQAGKSFIFKRFFERLKDHPRAGGEKLARTFGYSKAKGSPPRRRGKDIIVHPRCVNFRITPAQAGKSFIFKRFFERLKDHPRAGGEKLARTFGYSKAKGSPPRRRGKVRIEVGNNFLPRITSAQAGKSTIEVTYEDRDEDHPRAGGEKIGRYHTDGFVHGITPAQAGKSKD